VQTYGADGFLDSALYDGVTGEGNLSSFEYLCGGNNLIGTDEFYTGITGQSYTGEEVDYNGAGMDDELARDVIERPQHRDLLGLPRRRHAQVRLGDSLLAMCLLGPFAPCAFFVTGANFRAKGRSHGLEIVIQGRDGDAPA
jgi:hypothetical protein